MTVPAAGSVLIMAGGKGTRMANPSKPLLQIGNQKILETVFHLARKISQDVYLCGSQNADDVMDFAKSMGIRIIRAGGADYPEDLLFCLSGLKKRPTVILPGDIVVTDGNMFHEALQMAMNTQAAISTVLQRGEFVGISVYNNRDVLDSSWDFISIEVPGKFCININTPEDLDYARAFRVDR